MAGEWHRVRLFGESGGSSGYLIHSEPLDPPDTLHLVQHNFGGTPQIVKGWDEVGQSIELDHFHISDDAFEVYFTTPRSGRVECVLLTDESN